MSSDLLQRVGLTSYTVTQPVVCRMAEACSVTSKSSRTYKRVARTSQVDESLFGTTTRGKPGSLKQKECSSRAGKKAMEKSSPDVVTVSKGQLKRMMEPSPILTAAQVQVLQQQAQTSNEKERAHSNARKARMLAMEEARKSKVRHLRRELFLMQSRDLAGHRCQLFEFAAVPTDRNRAAQAASGPKNPVSRRGGHDGTTG